MSIPSTSTIAILGGAGNAGRPLVAEALSAGYHVRLLLRHPGHYNLTHDRLTSVPGDARNPDCLREMMQGCAALVSTLGNPRGEGLPMLSTVTKHLIRLLPEAACHRYITVTSLYTTDREQQHLPTKQASEYMQTVFPQFMADRRIELDLLTESGLDWTCVRLPLLVQEPATGCVKTDLAQLPGSQITVTDLARFLIDQLNDSRFVGKAPFIANG